MYEIIDRSTDLLLRITAPDLPQLFAEAARGLTSILVDSPEEVRPSREILFDIAGSPEELDYLLFDWLNELLYLFDTEEILLAKFDVNLTDEGLTANALGERLDPGRHRLNFEINNISYDHLSLDQTQSPPTAEIVINA